MRNSGFNASGRVSLIVLATILFSTSSLLGQKGKVLEGLSVASKILGYEINYSIYLPPDYDNSDRNYPVVYLLHGFSDNETAWVQFGEVNESADRAIESRDIPPMIIVMPDAKITWYINDAAGKNRFEDAIFEEFIPYIDSYYKTRASKEFRAVAGLSMGGYGSLIWALHHPDMFVACVPFSAGIFTDEEMTEMEQNQYDRRYGERYGVSEGENRLSPHWKKNSVLELMATMPVEEIEKVKFYIDCGDGDFLFRGNSSLHMLMRERNIEHEYRVRDGYHNWLYWRTGITDGLIFIGQKFHR